MYQIEPKGRQEEKIMIEFGKRHIVEVKGYCKGLNGFKRQMVILKEEGVFK